MEEVLPKPCPGSNDVPQTTPINHENVDAIERKLSDDPSLQSAYPPANALPDTAPIGQGQQGTSFTERVAEAPQPTEACKWQGDSCFCDLARALGIKEQVYGAFVVALGGTPTTVTLDEILSVPVEDLKDSMRKANVPAEDVCVRHFTPLEKGAICRALQKAADSTGKPKQIMEAFWGPAAVNSGTLEQHWVGASDRLTNERLSNATTTLCGDSSHNSKLELHISQESHSVPAPCAESQSTDSSDSDSESDFGQVCSLENDAVGKPESNGHPASLAKSFTSKSEPVSPRTPNSPNIRSEGRSSSDWSRPGRPGAALDLHCPTQESIFSNGTNYQSESESFTGRRTARRPSVVSMASSKYGSDAGSVALDDVGEVLAKERARLSSGVQSRAYNNDAKSAQAEMKLRRSNSTSQPCSPKLPRRISENSMNNVLPEPEAERTKDASSMECLGFSKVSSLSSNTSISSTEKQEAAQKLAKKIIPLKWLITLLTALIVALQCGGMILLSHKLSELVLSAAALASGSASDGAGAAAAFFVLLVYGLLAGFPTAMLVTYIAPNAGGSGIPDLKAHLNGNALPRAFGFRALFSRSVGLVLVTSAGLFAGTEGPFAHIGGIVGGGLSQGPPGRLKELLFGSGGPPGRLEKLLQWPLQLSGHQAHCEFIAQGAAIGVAAAFGAPVGGVLFTLEEASTFWSKDLTWRSFVGAMVASLLAKLVKNQFKGLGVGGFVDFPDVEASFAPWELIPFAIVGIITGLLGSLFCAIAKYIGSTRRKLFHLKSPQRHHKIGRVVEVLAVVTITLTVIFWVPTLLGCHDLHPARALGSTGRLMESQTPSYVGEMPTTLCPEGQYSDVAAVLLSPKEKAITALFTRSFKGGASFEISGLLAAGLITYVLTLLTFGSAMPAGLFIPNILFGACIGRAVGEELAIMAPEMDVHPGIYALMGAAGMLAGFSRMTVSLTMIMLEITSNMRMLFPLMLTIMIAKTVGDRFTVSVYDVILELNPDIHMLEDNIEEDRALMLETLNVHDVCNPQVVALNQHEQLTVIVRTLLITEYGGYPVVDADRHVLGIVTRIKLAHILCNFEERMAEDDCNPTVNILKYADTSPETIHWNANISRGYRQFTSSGIQHLCVVNEHHTLVGIITRTDLCMLTAHGAHGREAIQAIIDRKTAAEAAGLTEYSMPTRTPSTSSSIAPSEAPLHGEPCRSAPTSRTSGASPSKSTNSRLSARSPKALTIYAAKDDTEDDLESPKVAQVPPSDSPPNTPKLQSPSASKIMTFRELHAQASSYGSHGSNGSKAES